MTGDAGFDLMATHTAQVYAPPALAAGKRGAPALVQGDTPCLPLDYVSSQVAQRIGLDAPARLRQTFIEGRLTVRAGTLVYDGVRYPIKAAEPWDWSGAGAPEYSVIIVDATEASE